MRISGPTPVLPQVATQARSTRRPEADGPAQAPLATPAAPSETEPPVEITKPHGLVRAAEHSHRSDVAALRQWINHPDLRNALSLPDLSAEHKGKGFEKAVAAYEAAIASTPPPPDPNPVVVNPAPAAVDPAPVVTDPDPLLDVLLPESTPADEA